MRIIKEKLALLESYLPEVMNQKFWMKKWGIDEKIEYVRTLANVRGALWSEVERTFPEVIGKTYSINNSFVWYEDDEATQQIDAGGAAGGGRPVEQISN